MVIDVSKKYLPNMSQGFSSSKLTLNIGDGFKFMQNHENEFDVIITDASDPIGKVTKYIKTEYLIKKSSRSKKRA